MSRKAKSHLTDRPSGLAGIADQDYELVAIDSVQPHPRNVNQGDLELLIESIKAIGFSGALLVQRSSGNIIAGNHSWRAAKVIGLTQVPVVRIDIDDETALRRMLADNRITRMGHDDSEALALLLAELQATGGELAGTGFTSEDLENLMADLAAAQIEPTEGLTDTDEAPEPQTDPVSATGDVWILGRHVVRCGDATRKADVAALMQGELADLVFTDPPYNVGYEGYTKDKLTIQNDAMSPEAFAEFLRAMFTSYRAVIKPSASLYVCHASTVQREFQEAIENAGLAVRCQIIWAKNTFAWGFGRYKFQHEPIFYCHVAGESDDWYGDKSQSTLWQENKPAASRLHPTMKPVELTERALLNSSRAGDCVLDLFGGSGSTLIACERNARTARLLELDPRYCDVIVRRWQNFTGQQAVHENGSTFEEIAVQRATVAA